MDLLAQADSYAEVSPSNRGLKVFIKANKLGKTLSEGISRWWHRDLRSRSFFFTVTGERLQEYPSDIHLRQQSLDLVYASVFGGDEPGAAVSSNRGPSPPTDDRGSVALSDNEIVELACRKPRTGDKFRSLWDGNWNDHYNSASEADSSVVFTLAYYTKDAAQIDRIFRQSKLMRSKWDQLHGSETYGATTIAKALSKVTKQYTPKPKRTSARRPLPPEPANAGLPSIIIDDRQLGDLTSQALAAIKRANSPPSTFVRSGGLVRIVYDEQDIPKIETIGRISDSLPADRGRQFLHDAQSDGGYIPVGNQPTEDTCREYLGSRRLGASTLAGVARAPILRADGTICTTPGYDPTSRLMYCPDPSLTFDQSQSILVVRKFVHVLTFSFK